MKASLIRTKTTGILAVKAVAAVTIKPVAFVGRKITKEFNEVKKGVEESYVENNWDTLSNTDKFIAARTFPWACPEDDTVVQLSRAIRRSMDSHIFPTPDQANTQFLHLYNTAVELGIELPGSILDHHHSIMKERLTP